MDNGQDDHDHEMIYDHVTELTDLTKSSRTNYFTNTTHFIDLLIANRPTCSTKQPDL